MATTPDNPLSFFFDFFRDGLNLHKKMFLSYDSMIDIPDTTFIEINIEYEYKKAATQINGEGVVETIYYKDILQNKLIDESDKAVRLIQNRIKELSYSGRDFKYYLESIIAELNELKEIVKESKALIRYDSCIESVYKITFSLVSSYPSYFKNDQLPIVQESIDFNKSPAKPKVQFKEKISDSEKSKRGKEIYALKWKFLPIAYTMALHDCLKGVAIETDTLEQLKKAFSGERLNEPIQIKWIFNKNRMHPKPSLIRIINLLMNELELIHPISSISEMADKLEYIFVDSKGNRIRNVKNVYKDILATKRLSMQESKLHELIKVKLNSDNMASIKRLFLSNP